MSVMLRFWQVAALLGWIVVALVAAAHEDWVETIVAGVLVLTLLYVERRQP